MAAVKHHKHALGGHAAHVPLDLQRERGKQMKQRLIK
jgi:hypothetical protein